MTVGLCEETAMRACVLTKVDRGGAPDALFRVRSAEVPVDPADGDCEGESATRDPLLVSTGLVARLGWEADIVSGVEMGGVAMNMSLD
jgi:hypothetical protein